MQLSTIGLADVAGDREMTTDDSFRMGSITKTFTATAVLLLVDDGKVDLDEPIATYTGDLTAALPGGDTVTVREALGMYSGWPEYTNDPAGPYGQLFIEPTRELTAEDLVAAAATQPPTPAGEFTYVNTNYIVLGNLIEQVSGMSYSEFIKQRILDPVGLAETTIPDQTVTAETTSHGYLNDGWFDSTTRHPKRQRSSQLAAPVRTSPTSPRQSAGTAGNGVSTLSDLAKWAAADFGNVLLSDSSRTARLEGIPSDGILRRQYVRPGPVDARRLAFPRRGDLRLGKPADVQPDHRSGRRRQRERVLRPRRHELPVRRRVVPRRPRHAGARHHRHRVDHRWLTWSEVHRIRSGLGDTWGKCVHR